MGARAWPCRSARHRGDRLLRCRARDRCATRGTPGGRGQPCDRRKRRNDGKSDTLDAKAAERSVLAYIVTAIPKTTDGTAEMARQIDVARDRSVQAKRVGS